MVSIDRKALVTRHNPVRTKSDTVSPVQVGNGRFAFGADITGLQTFVPFATLSDWGWKSDPQPIGAPIDRNKIPGNDPLYVTPVDDQAKWLISNPNRANLGRVGLWFGDQDVKETDLSSCHQQLDLWRGVLESSFTWRGSKVSIRTVCHPKHDSIGVEVDSNLVGSGLGLFVDFPYCDGSQKFSAPYVGDWDKVSRHRSGLKKLGSDEYAIWHIMDDLKHKVVINGRGIIVHHQKDHRYVVTGSSLSVSFTFLPDSAQNTCPSAVDAMDNAQQHWREFWSSGGAIDLSLSSDPRWKELERRTVLSQYIMAINAAGKDPPQESGLVNLGWYGKFHLEMNVWHTAHLALFNRWSMLEPSLSVYARFLEKAKDRARDQGYQGARWPKMTDPDGYPSPGEINNLLIWLQPHPIFIAELDYSIHPNDTTLQKWKVVIHETANFMASYPTLNPKTGKYDLGPPLHIMSENTDKKETRNPAFELHYWRFGLITAIKWMKRLHQSSPDNWHHVLNNFAPVPIQDGVYVMWCDVVDMWTKLNWEHPSVIGLYGLLPGGDDLDHKTLARTSQKVWDTWNFGDCWGWDFGMLALNAARVGNPERAVEFLLHDKMPFDDVGLVPGGNRVPFPYLPSNGSFLYAVAAMAAGFQDMDKKTPGFPDGWTVRVEGMHKAL